MKNSCAITAVIPVHNGGRFLAAAIESVLTQTSPVHEVIVVDDGSTDDSREVAARFGDRVSCLSLPHRGPAAARNAGVERATGQFLAFLDADDLWQPEKLARQRPLISADPHVAVTGGWENFLTPAADQATVRSSLFPRGLQSAPMAGTLLIARKRFLEVGLFDVTLRAGEFIDWVLRARRLGLRFIAVPELIMHRRIHEANHSRQHETRNAAFFALIRKHRGTASVPSEDVAS